MSCLHYLLRYSTEEFQVLQLIAHAVFGACRGLTTYLLYVGALSGNLFLNDSRFVSLT